MRQFRLALWPAGLLFGIAAEAASHESGALAGADLVAGLTLIGLGLLAWERYGHARMGILLAASGFAWFLANLAEWATYLHRGPLIHLVLAYPTGRLRSRPARLVALAGYVYAAFPPVARNDTTTIVLAAVIVSAALVRYLAARGFERKARAFALIPAAVLASALAVGAVRRLSGPGSERAVLWTYDFAIGAAAALVAAGLVWGRWAQATVTGLVVELGAVGDAGPLRDRLARALGDPSLVLGYWLPDEARYVDETGRPVELPPAGSGRAVTPVEQDGRRVAALVHDASVLGEPGLVSGVAAATSLAVANVRLQADIRARVTDVEASRRRIVEAADTQRRRLERELREGAERRLARVAELLSSTEPPLTDAAAELDGARRELREFARGIHPATLIEHGLADALLELGARCPVPAEIAAPPERFAPAVEAVVYFVCSEALANVAKYSQATRASVQLTIRDGNLLVTVADDGIGGADPAAGSGLRGLADRVAALGGRFQVASRRGQGTQVRVELPLQQSG
jgi:signal transduction histidine kinase